MTTTNSLGTRVGVAILVSLAVVTASVATYAFTRPEQSLAQLAPSTDSVSFLAEAANAQAGVQNTAYVDRTLTDVLPNHHYTVAGVEISLASDVLVGRIVGVDSGERGGTVGSIVVTLAADTAFGMHTAPGDITFALQLPSGATEEDARAALVGSGLFVVVTSTNASFPAQSGAPSVYRDGALVLPVDDGRLIAPAAVGSDYLAGTRTLDQLVSAASAPVSVLPIRGGRIVEE